VVDLAKVCTYQPHVLAEYAEDRVAEAVFGEDSDHAAALFRSGEGLSLNDIRGKLAHGAITELSREDQDTVRKSLHLVAQAAKEFLLRIILQLQPEEAVPIWPARRGMGFGFADPRGMILSNDTTATGDDWRIRPEWCE
jgi:hypothetical protein